MNYKFKIENVNNVEVTVKFKATIGFWKSIYNQFESTHLNGIQFRRALDEAISRIEKEYESKENEFNDE